MAHNRDRAKRSDKGLLTKETERVASAQLARNSAVELLLTFMLLFGVTSIVRWVMGPSLISQTIPQINAELVIVGAAVALLLAGLLLSPPGKASGGHMNPAISLAMWRFGVFPGAGVVPYTIAQLLGTSTGGSLNPARQFGPAAVSGQTRFLWMYLLAPLLGAVIAAWLRQTIQHRRAVLTHRLCGTHVVAQAIQNAAPRAKGNVEVASTP